MQLTSNHLLKKYLLVGIFRKEKMLIYEVELI